MEYKGINMCDFCFEPVNPGDVCPNCGLTHDTYHAEVGLLLPGTNLLGKYIIGRVLGRGGFGATYLAYSSELDKVVAIKEYYPTGIANRGKGEEMISIVSSNKREIFEKGANRFFEEARTISKFNNNKNIVSVYEFFYANDTVYYSMEYLKGIDLKGYIEKKGGKIDETETISVMRAITEALVVVHSTQTMHRDISPDNIFVCTDGSVKLIDFGAAKQVVGDATQQVYSVVVKQGFAPAEQYKSSGRQGVWTDIYAVGATMYYAITGKAPTDAMNRLENPEIEFPSSVNISPQFKAIINKCLQSRIEDRYQSAIELLAAIDEINPQVVLVGGEEFVQDVYNGITSGLNGGTVNFNSGNPRPVMPHSQYNPFVNNGPVSGNPMYYSSQYPNSQYQVSKYVENKEKSGLAKGLIIGICSVVMLAIIVFLVISLTSQPMPMGPPPGGMPMGPQPPQTQPG